MMRIGDQITLPLYLVGERDRIDGMEEVTITKTGDKFLVAIDLPELDKGSTFVLPLFLVYGSRSERIFIENVLLLRTEENRFRGLASIGIDHESAVYNGRSLVNV